MHASSTPSTAVVIGAGIVGLACALRLQQCGLTTTLVDAQTRPQGASYGNAGHIAIEQVEPLASWSTLRSAPRRLFAMGGALDVRDPLWVAPWALQMACAASPRRFEAGRAALGGLLRQALPAWRNLVDTLGRRDLLRADGHVVVWESAASAARGRATWARADIGGARVRDLVQAELDELAAVLRSRPAGGVHFEGTAQVADPGLALEVMRDAFEACGGTLRQAPVRALSVQDGRTGAVLTDGSVLQGDCVLVAAGVGSRALLATLGIHAPLIAERGYHLQWSEHNWPLRMPPVVFEDRSLILTRFRSGLRAASFVEFARQETPPDPRKWRALGRHASDLGLPVGGEPQPWMGARPTLPDYLPAIGRSATAPGLLYACGHQHLGLTLAPLTAHLVAALATGRPPPVSVQPFDLARFSSARSSSAHFPSRASSASTRP
ncbi:NAD(P)/FAD-dependent oxidoreductase [Agrilutibacter solisilvae]|uniref:FAD-binding oxidoreductase n=1 Tax=Agrilutibacter solisilvae TaxID=2763317 RepID=A0A974Y1C4_9GAMM|nr:FAD-dependent oxidoreductase [Lysobacter solisilvae]QSX79438.1 FAD-binding oxidoreductase [Lysobacter solisilvae]